MKPITRVLISYLIYLIVSPSAISSLKVISNCKNCVDSGGNNCDEFLRRFAKTKYWVLKGNAMQSFSEAQKSCRSYGKTIARAGSDADVLVLKNLSEESGYESYWVAENKLSGGLSAMVMEKSGEPHSKPNEQGQHATICQYPMGHPCLAVESMPRNTSLDSTNPNCPHPQFDGDNQFVRTGPNSKYLFPLVRRFGTWEYAKNLCLNVGLEVATIATIMDFLHLKSYWIVNNKLDEPKGKVFYATLAAKVSDTGVIKNANSGEVLKFQLFNAVEISKHDKGCVALESANGVVQFAVVPCENENFMPLCQFKRDTECYKDSPLSVYEAEEKDELFFVDSSGKRSFYGSRKQKSWSSASSFCEKNNMKLVDFIKKDKYESKMVWGIMEKYKNSLNFPFTTGKSWTSGVFQEGFKDGGAFTFKSNGEKWTRAESSKHFEVIADGVRKPKTEKCLVVTDAQKLRPFFCDLPNYFLCYKLDEKEESTTAKSSASGNGTESDASEEAVSTNATAKSSTCKGEPIILSFNPDGLTNAEVLSLIGLSQNLNFGKGYSSVLKIKEESAWRIPHVKAMGMLTKHTCPEPFVSKEYVNVLMNLIMIYYNSMSEAGLNVASQLFWKNLKKRYRKCQNISEPFEFQTVGGLITLVESKDHFGPIVMAKETVDSAPLDYVLEGLWYMFQVTAGACYNLAKWKTTWLAEYFFAFKTDFTDQFKDWWLSQVTDNYGLLFGDMDLYENLYNLRACAAAGFQRLGISDRLPVRPLLINDTNYVTQDMNQRVLGV